MVLPLFDRKVTINYNVIKKKIYPEQECLASFHQVQKPEEIHNTSDLVIWYLSALIWIARKAC